MHQFQESVRLEEGIPTGSGLAASSKDWYKSTRELMVIRWEIPWSAGENFRCNWEQLQVLATRLGVPTAGVTKESG
jgi:hypothetical protein